MTRSIADRQGWITAKNKHLSFATRYGLKRKKTEGNNQKTTIWVSGERRQKERKRMKKRLKDNKDRQAKQIQ